MQIDISCLSKVYTLGSNFNIHRKANGPTVTNSTQNRIPLIKLLLLGGILCLRFIVSSRGDWCLFLLILW
jgi:hypothetical protein